MRWPPVPDLVADLRAEDRTPTDVVGEALDRIRKHDPDLGAFTSVNGAAMDRAEALEARGPEGNPLHGLPVAVKDNHDATGMPTTYGSTLYADHHPDRDHPVVERLRAAGAVVVGKTNMAPFGLLALAINDLHGPTRNPWDRSRSPGGSSGGSAAAVAAGLVPAATGSDGGGSIRIPASWCGLPGLKPSRGRVPNAGGPPIFQGLSVPGLLARTPAGTAALLDVVTGPHRRDPDALPTPEAPFAEAVETADGALEETDVGYAPDLGGHPVEPAVADLAREAAGSLEALGADVVDVDPDLPDEQEAMVSTAAAEALAFLEATFEDWEDRLWAPLASMAAGAVGIGTADYIRARAAGTRLWEALERVYEDHDLLATPTTAVPPVGAEEIGVDDVDGEAVGPLGWMPFTFPFNFTGQPAVTVPAGRTDDGLPVGLQIVGPPRSDRRLLAVTEAYRRGSGPWPEPPLDG